MNYFLKTRIIGTYCIYYLLVIRQIINDRYIIKIMFVYNIYEFMMNIKSKNYNSLA